MPNNYVDKAEMYVAMKAYIEACNAVREEAEAVGEEPVYPQIPNYLGECFLLMAKGLASAPNFSGYPFKEEMIMDGVECCVRYIKSFDPEKTENPFAYFTQVIYYSFVRRINSEKTQMYIKHVNYQKLQIVEILEGQLYSAELNEISNEFIRDYEKKRLTKRKKSSRIPSNNVVQHFGEDD